MVHTIKKVINIGEIVLKTDRCTLWQGDCLEIMKEIPDHSVDLILCDLPYGTTQCKWDTIIPFNQLWIEYNRVIAPDKAIVLFGGEPFSSALRMSNIKQYKYDWKWDKKQCGNPLNAKRQPLKTYEDIIVFNAKSYYPQMRTGKLRKKGGLTKQPEHTGKVDLEYCTYNDQYYPTAILEFSNAHKSGKVHPCQKPVDLLKYLVRTYTGENEIILDNCMGSGSTGVAALNTNRRFIGIELDPTYCGIAKQRILEVDKLKEQL